ncbi:MAG: hypothetical protein J6Y47_00100 [Bacteroidales bacterium]|nr:hypothetical protein [Bacteroidales bacterium]
MKNLKQYLHCIALITCLLLFMLSCASRQYAPKSPRRTHRCGDCPRFTQTENNISETDGVMICDISNYE